MPSATGTQIEIKTLAPVGTLLRATIGRPMRVRPTRFGSSSTKKSTQGIDPASQIAATDDPIIPYVFSFSQGIWWLSQHNQAATVTLPHIARGVVSKSSVCVIRQPPREAIATSGPRSTNTHRLLTGPRRNYRWYTLSSSESYPLAEAEMAICFDALAIS